MLFVGLRPQKSNLWPTGSFFGMISSVGCGTCKGSIIRHCSSSDPTQFQPQSQASLRKRRRGKRVPAPGRRCSSATLRSAAAACRHLHGRDGQHHDIAVHHHYGVRRATAAAAEHRQTQTVTCHRHPPISPLLPRLSPSLSHLEWPGGRLLPGSPPGRSRGCVRLPQ